MSADQLAAFLANGGFTPSFSASLLVGSVFAVLLVWGVWAIRCAYVGWAEDGLPGRSLLAVIVRVTAMYLVLAFLLLS